jgi:SAM-dependent methyltransferase
MVASDLKDGADVLNVGDCRKHWDRGSTVDGLTRRYIDYFPNCNYYTLDKYGVFGTKNHYKMDVMKMGKLKKKFDLVVVMNLLEHLPDPFGACANIAKLLKPNGRLFASSPFIYPRHEDKKFKDYFRFTDLGLKAMFPTLKAMATFKSDTNIVAVERDGEEWQNPNVPSGYSVLFQETTTRR